MTRDQANRWFAAILETVADTPDGAPEAPIFAALITDGCALNAWSTLVEVGLRGGIWTRENHVLRATEKGRDMAAQLAAERGAR